jgi:hypothetical protein
LTPASGEHNDPYIADDHDGARVQLAGLSQFDDAIHPHLAFGHHHLGLTAAVGYASCFQQLIQGDVLTAQAQFHLLHWRLSKFNFRRNKPWSVAQRQAQSKVHRLAIHSIIDAERSLTFSTVEALDQALDDMALRTLEVPKPGLFLAAAAFAQDRRSGGIKNTVLGDFLIGAHAAVSKLPVLTRNTRRTRNYFPSVRLVAPD